MKTYKLVYTLKLNDPSVKYEKIVKAKDFIAARNKLRTFIQRKYHGMYSAWLISSEVVAE